MFFDVHDPLDRLNTPRWRIFISPPFGNYVKTPFSVSVKGTFTWQKRNGLLKQLIKTLRPISGGYVNRMGLRNPGIQTVNLKDPYAVYSVTGLTEEEWDNLIEFIPPSVFLEINLGCPNVVGNCFNEGHLKKAVDRFPHLIFKLPPTINLHNISYYGDHGVRRFHISNTLPTSQGGESGKRLKEINLPLIEAIKQKHPSLFIMAGGGIYGLQDALDYHRAGADGFSLSTVWFNPLRGARVLRAIQKTIIEPHLPKNYQPREEKINVF